MLECLINIWRPVLEIIIIWYVFYQLLKFIKGTPAVLVLRGLIVLIIFFFVAYFITQKLGLGRITWLLPKFLAIFLISFLIIFQPELRRGLAQLGQNPILSAFLREENILSEIADATILFSKRRVGAIIAIEREIGLKPYIESGVFLDGKVTSETLVTIFTPATPLHDGGVIISEGRLMAAGCLFPLTQNPRVAKTLGTRHRAAIGLTEETDAVVVVISEETGQISVAVEGKLHYQKDRQEVINSLNKALFSQRPKRKLRLIEPTGHKR